MCFSADKTSTICVVYGPFHLVGLQCESRLLTFFPFNFYGLCQTSRMRELLHVVSTVPAETCKQAQTPDVMIIRISSAFVHVEIEINGLLHWKLDLL